MKDLLGIYCFIRNGFKYDYPFVESIESAVPVADQIVINECHSDDDTFDKILELKDKYPNKIKVIRSDWVTHHSELSIRGNECIPHLSTRWHWQLQADEVLHEKDYETIRKVLQDSLTKPVDAFKVHYWHFMANYETEFDFCYVKAARIGRKGRGWWLTGDAAEIAGGNPNMLYDFTPDGPKHLDPKEVSDLRVFHYGKVKEGAVGWQKEWDFTQLYKDLGFPDPKMKEMEAKFGEQFCDYVYVFEGAIERGEVRKFVKTHPAIMKERIANFKSGGYEQFVSRFKSSLDLNKLENQVKEALEKETTESLKTWLDNKRAEERVADLSVFDKKRIYSCEIAPKNVGTIDEFATQMKNDWNMRILKDPIFYIIGSHSDEDWLQHTGQVDFDKHFLPRFEKIYGEDIVSVPVILEIGCGIGRMSQYISACCDKLIAADISSACLDVAERRLSYKSNIEYRELDGNTLIGIDDNSVDTVFEYIVFQHIGSLDVIESYIKEVSRVLKPGGHFIMHARANDFSVKVMNNLGNTFHGACVTLEWMQKVTDDIKNLEIVEQNISDNDYWGIIKKL